MRRWWILVVLLTGLVLWGVGDKREASATKNELDQSKRIWKADPLGVSPFLVGRWRGQDPENNKKKTTINLENPTRTQQFVMIIFYDTAENFRQCDVRKLTRHDIVTFSPPTIDFFGASMLAPASGAFEVLTTAADGVSEHLTSLYGFRSASTRKVNEAFHDGIVGDEKYPGEFQLPLHQVNPLFFSNPVGDDLEDCLCPKLDALGEEWWLTELFEFAGVECNEE